MRSHWWDRETSCVEVSTILRVEYHIVRELTQGVGSWPFKSDCSSRGAARRPEDSVKATARVDIADVGPQGAPQSHHPDMAPPH